jgi:hypothetical protein
MTVLVGVKRSSDSRAAIRLAAQEALYRDTTLIAIMAYPAERGWSPAVKPGGHQPHPRRRPGRPPRTRSARPSATRSATRPSGWTTGSSRTCPDAPWSTPPRQ